MMNKGLGFVFGSLLVALPPAASANFDMRNDIPSCYEYAKVAEANNTEIERELFVVVDQTVHLDTNMKKNVHAQVSNFGRPSDKVTIVTFSAMAQGEYTNIPFTGFFEQSPTVDVKNNMNAISLRNLESCLGQQQRAMKAAHSALKDSFNDADESYPRTELVGTVLSIGNDLVSRSPAKRKVVLLVSDMLENSETLSFYSRGSVKVPDASKSYKKILEQGFEGDFNGAEVHVIGAGYVHGGKNYSSQKSMIELEKFWRQVFANSNVEMKQFGKPNLLRNIQ